MSCLEIKTAKGIFGIALDDVSHSPHFYIKCGCQKTDNYSGCRLKGEPKPNTDKKFNCTYWRDVHSFADLIKEHDDDLTLVCNDCEKEFPFTQRVYSTLLEMIQERAVASEVKS